MWRVLLPLALPCWAMIHAQASLELWGAWSFISLISYLTMAWDKFQAGRQANRVPESRLHLLELLGGWPGSLVAQGHWRHKTRKSSYQRVFWSILICYQVAAILVLL